MSLVEGVVFLAIARADIPVEQVVDFFIGADVIGNCNPPFLGFIMSSGGAIIPSENARTAARMELSSASWTIW